MVRGTALGERADLSRLLFRQPRTLPVLSVHAVHLQRLPQPVSVRMGRIMQSSKLGYQTWAVAFYIAVPNIKGISSMKLHRALGITEKAAWHVLQRFREVFSDVEAMLSGTVEIDEF